jgi:WD40 repeat protein
MATKGKRYEPTADPLVLKVQGRVEFNDPSFSVDPIAFSREGSRLVTLSLAGERTARLWRLDLPREPPIPLLASAWIRAAAFTTDGSRVVIAAEDGVVHTWRVEEPTARPVQFRGHDRPIKELAFNSDGSRLVTLGADGTARIWSLDQSGTRPHGSADDRPIEGDPKTFLNEWQKRLGLKIGEDGEIVPVDWSIWRSGASTPGAAHSAP